MSKTPQVLVFPGASLMNIGLKGDDTIIECPGCGEVATINVHPDGMHVGVAVLHGDNCPIHAQITEAIKRQESHP